MFMFRIVQDDTDALKMMNAMEAAGATVVGITVHGEETWPGCSRPHQTFQVWAKIENALQPDEIDKMFEELQR